MGVNEYTSADPRDGRNVLHRLRRWVYHLDKSMRVPGTNIRFGWDPIIGLVPWLGDAVTGLFSVVIVMHAFRLGVPGFVKVRMMINVLVDVIVGLIPFLGDAFDFVWKANRKNMELLEKYAMTAKPASAGDRLFVLGAGLVFLVILLLPILLAWLLISAYPSVLPWL